MKLKTDRLLEETKKLISSEADIESRYQHNIHTIDLINKSLYVFQWKNVPETIVPRSIEKRLFIKGKLVYFRDKLKGDLILPFTYTSSINDEGEYTRLRPYSIVGEDYPEMIINEECVVIRDSDLEIPPLVYADYYGEKIADLFDIRLKNNNWLNLPFIFSTTGDRGKDSKNALEVKQIMVDGKKEIAYITDAFNSLNFFDLKPQYFGAEIEEQIKVMKNNYLEYLGINHLNFDKKERMITSEVEIKNEENSINLNKRLKPRQYACEKIKEIFNVDLQVEVADDFKYLVDSKQVISSK